MHKPALDGIGYQDLVTGKLAWWDDFYLNGATQLLKQYSAGKQPAWINYMTAVNEVRGNFAEQNDQMWMTLNRRYEPMYFEGGVKLKDLTTYVDPSKFNHIFANTRRDAQNFWVQIRTDIQVRRKMSTKIIPNL